MKRIVALLGVVILVALYIVTLISAITTSPQTPELFKACVAATIIIPVFMYAYIMIYRLQQKKVEENRANFPKFPDEDDISAENNEADED